MDFSHNNERQHNQAAEKSDKGNQGNKAYKFDRYVPKPYFKAVNFALKMINKGMPFFFAINKASYHYHVDENIIINYLPERVKKKRVAVIAGKSDHIGNNHIADNKH